jgi:hypothetical protein
MTDRQIRSPCRSGPTAREQAPSRFASHQAYSRWRTRQIAYGRWQPWADAGPVRDHVRALRGHGASYRAIAQAAGVSAMTVHHLLNGSGSQTGQLPHRMGAAQASRLLAVRIPVAAGSRRDACGARRRLQGLVALGHCPAALARRAGIADPPMRRLLTGQTRRISPALHATVEVLYDQMWNHLPPERTRREQAVADAARHRAQAAGWPPPMALDDDRIDDPAYRPRTAWRRAAGLPPAAQPPRPRLCTALPSGPGYPQELPAAVTHRQAVARLSAASADGKGQKMNSIEVARTRAEQAAGLAAVLDASYAAFLMLVPVIERQQDPASAWFVPFVMAGSSAAGGRFALLDAPSLPAASRASSALAPAQLPADETAAAVISLTQVVAIRLDSAALAARDAADRNACARAARHARQLCAGLGGAPPP